MLIHQTRERFVDGGVVLVHLGVGDELELRILSAKNVSSTASTAENERRMRGSSPPSATSMSSAFSSRARQ